MMHRSSDNNRNDPLYSFPTDRVNELAIDKQTRFYGNVPFEQGGIIMFGEDIGHISKKDRRKTSGMFVRRGDIVFIF